MTKTRPPLPKAVKGGRPVFLDDPDSDRLATMLVALMGEVSLLADKLDTLSRVAAEKPVFSLADLEAYVPDDAVAAERAQRRSGMIARVLRVLHADAEAQANPSAMTYAQIRAAVAGEGEP